MTKPVIFLGESLQIAELRETCDLLGMSIAGIIDDDFYGNTKEFDGIPYIGSELNVDWESLKKDHDFFITVNPIPNVPRNVAKRKNFIRIIDQYDLPCVNIIDPECRISPRAHLGKGIYVGYSAYIALHAQIGDHCQIHFNSGVMHNTVFGRNSVLQRASMTTAHVTVGENVYIAPGAKIMQWHSQVGSDSFVQSGVMVFRDVEPGEVVGITGRKIYPVIADFAEE